VSRLGSFDSYETSGMPNDHPGTNSVRSHSSTPTLDEGGPGRMFLGGT